MVCNFGSNKKQFVSVNAFGSFSALSVYKWLALCD